jgi:transcriptional regulator GlxA family with amidase domain
VHKAVRQILKNLKDGIVRLAPLYDQLKVGHTALGNAFKKAGMGSPAEFIRQEQLSLAVRLLVDTRMKISQIARESGFISMTHFANFIKHNTGMSARELRNGGEVAILPDKTAIQRHNSELRGKLRS